MGLTMEPTADDIRTLLATLPLPVDVVPGGGLI